MTEKNKKLSLCLLIFLFFLSLSIFYLQGAYKNAVILNTDETRTDQDAYLNFAERMVKSNYKYMGDRNRMPLFPFLISFVYSKNREVFFLRAKILNIYLSLLYLVILFLIFLKYLPLLESINLILVIAFTVYLFKAPNVQAELTYYTLFFITFLILISVLINPSLEKCFLAGISAALTQLTKASMLPLIISFVLVFTMNILITLYKEKIGTSPIISNSIHERTKIFYRIEKEIQRIFEKFRIKNARFLYLLLCFFLFISTFLTVLSPYLYESKKFYGGYFFNVSINYYMWHDSWEEVKTNTDIYNKYRLEEIANLPLEAVPGPGNYLRDNGIGKIFVRIANGLLHNFHSMKNSYGYFKYILIFIFLLSASILFNFSKAKEYFLKYFFPISFFAVVIGVYTISISFYTSIAGGNRFILGLFLPFTFSLYYTGTKLNKSIRKNTVKTLFIVLNILLFINICFEIYTVLSIKIITVLGDA